MDAENFFSRWSRRKAQARLEHEVNAAEEKPVADETGDLGDLAGQPVQEPSPPTMEDVAALTPQCDFRRFLAQGVDPAVRRSAMKKMLADPHFNVMDGLDIYIDDYNKFQPLPDVMLAALNHAQGVLNPQPLFDSAPERVLEEAGDSASLTDEGTEMEPTSLSEEEASETEAFAPPVTETLADGSTVPDAPQEHTEKPEDGPDHGNQISRM